MKTAKQLPLIVGILLVVAVISWGFWPRGDRPLSKSLVVGSWGGAYQTAQRKAFFEPFTEAIGVQITETSTPDYGKIYEWQRSEKASANVLDVETFFVYQAGRKGALARIDRSKLPKDLMKGSVTDFGVASCAYAELIAWNSDTFAKAADLQWKDFWDTDRFPGARGLRDLPATALEAALMADGVPPAELYPLDVNRAFLKLDELRQKTRIVLWTSGSQPVEFLKDGTVTLSTAWNGRIYDAKKEGLPLAMSFNQATLDWLWWVIPANAENKDLAMQFISFTLDAERQASLVRNIPYGPTNNEAWKDISESNLRQLPNAPLNMTRVVIRDNEWWSQHEEEVSDRWREWKLKIQ